MNADVYSESYLLKKLPLKEHFENIKRILKLLTKLDKTCFLWHVFSALISAGMTYGGMALSAYVVNHIEAGKDYQNLMKTAALVCVALSVGAAILYYINKQIDIKETMIAAKYWALQQEKIMDMDFSLVDSPRLKEIRERIQQDNNWGWGIRSLFWDVRCVFNAFLKWIFAVVISVPMFAYFHGKAGVRAGAVMAVLAVCIVFGVRLSMYCQKQAEYTMFHVHSKEERKIFGDCIWDFAWGTGYYNYKSGKDVRIYNSYDMMKYWTYDKRQTKEYRDYYIKRPALGFAGGTAARNGLFVLIMAAAYFIVSMTAIGGSMPVGSVVLYAGCLAQLLNNIVEMVISGWDITLVAKKQVSILELLSISDEMYKGALPLEKRSDNEYHIEFRNVSFKYPGSEEYALQNFSMSLRVGEKMAIVGRNGSGKTTMIKLLCRLYDPQEGEILVNGVDIRKFKHEEYSQLFSVVFQDYELMALMLAENVAADMEYDAEKVKKCLMDAGFGERLAELGEKGIENYLYKSYTDDGIEISGGESQKIAIARSIYKEAPFVLLDEPTAALDPIAESEIYENFDKIAGDKTAIYISHRLSSCKFCDRIAVFDKGRLVQMGSHEELLADEDGVYAGLWNAQARYYETTVSS